MAIFQILNLRLNFANVVKIENDKAIAPPVKHEKVMITTNITIYKKIFLPQLRRNRKKKYF